MTSQRDIIGKEITSLEDYRRRIRSGLSEKEWKEKNKRYSVLELAISREEDNLYLMLDALKLRSAEEQIILREGIRYCDGELSSMGDERDELEQRLFSLEESGKLHKRRVDSRTAREREYGSVDDIIDIIDQLEREGLAVRNNEMAVRNNITSGNGANKLEVGKYLFVGELLGGMASIYWAYNIDTYTILSELASPSSIAPVLLGALFGGLTAHHINVKRGKRKQRELPQEQHLPSSLPSPVSDGLESKLAKVEDNLIKADIDMKAHQNILSKYTRKGLWRGFIFGSYLSTIGVVDRFYGAADYIGSQFDISTDQSLLLFAFEIPLIGTALGGYIGRKLAQRKIKKLEASRSTPAQLPSGPQEDTSFRHILMPQTGTYALGVHALQEKCREEGNIVHPQFVLDDRTIIYRSLTLREDMEARVNDYNTLKNADGSKRSLDDRLRFFKRWLDSCTGIAYKKGTTLFKIMPQSKELITIPRDFTGHYLPIDYNSIQGVELDSSKGVYGAGLSLSSVPDHEGWLASVDNDKALLRGYAGIVSSLLSQPPYNRTKAMGFYVRQNTTEDELRALFVNILLDYSNALGNFDLSYGGSFLRCSPSPSLRPGT